LWPPVDNRTYAEPEPAELAYERVFLDLIQLNTAIAAELFPNVERGERRTLKPRSGLSNFSLCRDGQSAKLTK
jgi:hypothetical protein